ncbi:MAG TPA: type II secretion system F family protein [Caulobacteraceae bacterium]
MPTFRYRAATSAGEMRAGTLDGATASEVLERLRRLGLMPIEAVETKVKPGAAKAKVKVNAVTRQAVANAIGELAVLLEAGLPLDRAMGVTVENAPRALAAPFTALLKQVKEGAPLSRAMAEQPSLFPPMASAMAEAGEANGKLGAALARLGETLNRAEALRQTITSSLVYPTMLLIVAFGVILMMLLVVVPQFQTLFEDSGGSLPPTTRAIMALSLALKHYGWAALLVLIGAVLLARQWLKRSEVRRGFDRWVLGVPQIGTVIRNAETARFARTLGSLVEGGVPLPSALAIAQRSLANAHMAEAIASVTQGIKRGGGLSGPLGATRLFPPMAMSFLRTGEETAQLGPMLNRLADVLDRNVRTSIERMIAVLTPAITVVMGLVVATVIASIMSAILGFNDLALAP